MIFRSGARKISQARYYLYVSDTKLDMLFEQIAPELRKRISAEVKVDLKLAGITLRGADSQGPTRMDKLRIVERFIYRHHTVGTVEKPGLEFFHGQLSMNWGCIDDAVLFRSDDRENSRCVVLSGSRRHVLGEASPRWRYTGGRSWLPEFLKVLQSTSGGDDLERDWPKFLLERFLFNSTPPQQLDFLAVRWAEADYGSYDQRIHVILGTPLYVAITPAATRLTELEVTRSENLTRTLDDRTRILAVDVLLPKIEEISEAADNSAYSHMIEALKDLRASYHALDLPANALQLDWRVLGIPEDKGPNLDCEDIVIVLGNLAESCRALGRAAEALHLDKQALDILEATPHPPPYMVRVALGNLAASYRALDRPTEALPLDERALAIAEAAPRPYHAELAIALGNLAATYRALGRAADALPLDERAIRIAEVALRPDDPRMAVALANLAATYRALGRIPEAKHLERVVGRMGSKPDHS